MNILVTGGAGYIGSILVPELLRRRHHVTVIDTFRDGGTSLAACCADDLFLPVRADCRDMSKISYYVGWGDIVIPLAGLVGAPLCASDQIGAVSTNQTAIEALMRIVSRQQLVIFPTTNSGYGIGPADGPCTEESMLVPLSLYAATKVGAERAVLEGGGVSLRLATLFGMSPRMRLDLLVNDFVWRAVSDRVVVLFEGHFRRNYLHVRDVAHAFLHAIGNGGFMRGQAYNVGLSSANLTKVALCEKIREHVPGFAFFEAPVGEDPDKRDYIVSNDKIEGTGWRPRYSLDDGIQELIRGYRMLRNGRYSNV